MLEYCSYALRAQLCSEGVYASNVMRHDGRLQYYHDTYFCTPCPWPKNRKYQMIDYELTPAGILLHKGIPVNVPPLHTFSDGLGIACHGNLIAPDGSTVMKRELLTDALVFTIHNQMIAYITAKGECWVVSCSGVSYQIPLPYKPLGLCSDGEHSIYFLTPNEELQQWLYQPNNTYIPASIYKLQPDVEWSLREVFICNG